MFGKNDNQTMGDLPPALVDFLDSDPKEIHYLLTDIHTKLIGCLSTGEGQFVELAPPRVAIPIRGALQQQLCGLRGFATFEADELTKVDMYSPGEERRAVWLMTLTPRGHAARTYLIDQLGDPEYRRDPNAQ